jgi:hypothetical protein
LDSQGPIPSDIVSIPFLLTLGLCLEPKSFVRFRPTIA